MKYDLQSIHQMVSADPTMKFLYFWGHTPSAKGITQTCLSQWFDVAFEVDGVKYHTAAVYDGSDGSALQGLSHA